MISPSLHAHTDSHKHQLTLNFCILSVIRHADMLRRAVTGCNWCTTGCFAAMSSILSLQASHLLELTCDNQADNPLLSLFTIVWAAHFRWHGQLLVTTAWGASFVVALLENTASVIIYCCRQMPSKSTWSSDQCTLLCSSLLKPYWIFLARENQAFIWS